MEPPILSAEELLQHAGWLRGLARRLVGEAHADDVLQETWKTALERPPRSRAALPAWLAQVARNAARQIRRSETARHRREAKSARADIDMSAAAVVERADLHRLMVDEVMALDEPYRQVLLLRWFEEREPVEIAALVGMSAGTVRSQLKRGLERLRERLDRRFGDRKTWISAFAPIAFGRPARIVTTGGGALTGGLLMSLKSKTVLPLLAVLLLGGVVAVSIAATTIDAPSTNETAEMRIADGPPAAADDAPALRPAVLFGRAAERRRGPGGLTARVARIDSGDAVEGARILLAGRSLADEDVERRTTTDADGRFQLAALPAGDAYVLSVEGAGLPPLGLPSIPVTAGRIDDLGTLWLGTPGALDGRVLAASGRPVAGATVRVFATTGPRRDFMKQLFDVFSALDREPVPEAETTTGRDGRFEFESLPPGTVCIEAAASGHRSAYVSAAVVPGAPTATLTLRLTPGRVIRGTVVDENGAPLAGARVAAVPGQMDFDAVMYGRRFTSSDARGRFEFLGAARDADLMLVAAYSGRPAVMSELAPNANDVTLTIRSGATLDVHILAADGKTPVADAEVSLFVGLTDDLQGRDSQTVLVGRTDAAGSLLLDAWPGRIQIALLSHPDHAPGLWLAMMAAGGMPGVAKGPTTSKIEAGRQRLEFTFPSGSVVRGRVLDPRGRGIAGARVRAVRFGMPDTTSVWSDDTGRYEVVMPFSSQLRVDAPGYAQSPDSSLSIAMPTPGEPTEHDVKMVDAAVVTGRVMLPDGTPAAGALVRLRSGDGQFSPFSVRSIEQVFARADGRFLMDSVMPGQAWHVLARLPGFVDGMAGPFAVEASGQTRSPDVVLLQGVTVAVTVRGESGEALEGARVGIAEDRSALLAWDPMHLEAPFGVTGDDGVATVGPLAPGTRELRVGLDGYVAFSRKVELLTGDPGPIQESVTLERGRVIQGHVRDATGKGIGGARIQAISVAAPTTPALTTSDTSGRFEVSGVIPADVTIEVRAEGFRPATQTLAEGAESIIDVRLMAADPTSAGRRAELEAQRQVILERLMSTQDETAREALVEALADVDETLQQLRGD